MIADDDHERMVAAVGPAETERILAELAEFARVHDGCTILGASLVHSGDEMRVTVQHERGCPLVHGGN